MLVKTQREHWRGRPRMLTPKLEERILAELRDGRLMGAICEAEGMPHRTTVQRWMSESPEFRAKVYRAREIGTDALAESAMTIADEAPPMPGDVAKARLRSDVRLKLAAAWNQGTYGNRPAVVVQNEAPRVQLRLDADKLAALAEAMRRMLVEEPIDVTPRKLAPSRRL